MNKTIFNIAIELGFLLFLFALYYYFQKKRITNYLKKEKENAIRDIIHFLNNNIQNSNYKEFQLHMEECLDKNLELSREIYQEAIKKSLQDKQSGELNDLLHFYQERLF